MEKQMENITNGLDDIMEESNKLKLENEELIKLLDESKAK
jgi:regulator of replication initiation timing